MQRSALERLPRTTDVFARARTAPGAGSPAGADIDPAAAGYYPPLPVAADRPDLPEVLRTLLWGWDVVGRLARAGIKTVETRPFDGDAREAILLILALEDRAGAYSVEERRCLLGLLEAAGVAPDAAINERVADGAPFAAAARRYAELPDGARQLVSDGTLDLKNAERLADFPEATRRLQSAVAGLSFSNRRQFAAMLWEVAQRDELADEDLAALVGELAGADGGPLPALRRRRYPTLSALEGSFTEVSDRALSGSGVSLHPPANFEGGRFRVEFSFASRRELATRISALQRLEDEVDELFSLL